MKTVIIGTPSHDGKIDVNFANSLAESIKLGLQNKINIVPIYISYDALVQRARNDIVKIAIENKNIVSKVIFIDSDTSWNPEDLIEIIEAKENVLGYPVRKKNLQEEIYNVKILNFSSENIKDKMSVDSIGTGFLAIDIETLENIWNNSEKYDETNRMVFEVKIIAGKLYSEDTYFCQKLKNLGYEIILDTTKIINHHEGSVNFVGNFKEFLKKLNEK